MTLHKCPNQNALIREELYVELLKNLDHLSWKVKSIKETLEENPPVESSASGIDM